MVLLRNICGLLSPITGWDAFPAVTDLTREADIARIKYFRNTVYAHAEHASVDDATFNTYWQDIRDTLVRLGGVKYKAAIDNLETECMDPDIEDHYKELLNQWKRDENSLKDQLETVIKRLDEMTASSSTAPIRETSDEGKTLKQVDLSNMCREQHHEDEPLNYYCQECKVCICGKCGQTRHTRHTKVDIQQAAHEQKPKIMEVLQEMKVDMADYEIQMEKTTELCRKSREKIAAARNNVQTTVEELVRVLREHEAAMVTKLDVLDEAEQRDHATQLEHFQTCVTQFKTSVEHCEVILQRNSSFEILQAQQDVIERSKGLIKATKMDIYKPSHVYYKINEDYVQNVRSGVPGRVDVSDTNPLRSLAGGRGLKEAEAGKNSNFTIVTNDSDGKRCYYEIDQITVKVQTPSGEGLDYWVKHVADGKHRVTYTPNCDGRHEVMIEVNDQPLPRSPWSVQVRPHQYTWRDHRGKRGKAQGQFKEPCDVAINKKTGTIAVVDRENNRIQLFDPWLDYISAFGQKGPSAKKLSNPTSVAFTNTGNLIIIASSAMYCFNENGQFLNSITNKHVKDPFKLTITCDGHMVVSDRGDKSVKVLSPDGTELVRSFSASDCDESPWIAVCHQNMLFVSYPLAHVVKVFSEEGEFLYGIGSEKSGDGHLSKPLGFVIDRFNNLVVCDGGNSDLKVFTLDGKFLNKITSDYSREYALEYPCSVASSSTEDLLVIADSAKDCVFSFW